MALISIKDVKKAIEIMMKILEKLKTNLSTFTFTVF